MNCFLSCSSKRAGRRQNTAATRAPQRSEVVIRPTHILPSALDASGTCIATPLSAGANRNVVASGPGRCRVSWHTAPGRPASPVTRLARSLLRQWCRPGLPRRSLGLAFEGLESRKVFSLSPVGANAPYPLTAIVKLEMTYPDGREFVGSGVMVDSFHVLTAGHVVYDYAEGGWASQILVIPELNGSSEPFGTARMTYERTYDTWMSYSQAHPGSTSTNALDIGLITLDKTIGNETGWMAYGYNSDDGDFRRRHHLRYGRLSRREWIWRLADGIQHGVDRRPVRR